MLAAILEWSKVTVVQFEVTWQSSQVFEVAMWPGGGALLWPGIGPMDVECVPSWQEKQPPIMPVCLNWVMVQFNGVSLWQSSQTFDVFKWPGGGTLNLPLAGGLLSLWQEKHEPSTRLWSKLLAGTGTHAVTTWQSAQSPPTLKCAADLPVAPRPLWQEKHEPCVPV